MHKMRFGNRIDRRFGERPGRGGGDLATDDRGREGYAIWLGGGGGGERSEEGKEEKSDPASVVGERAASEGGGTASSEH